MLKIVDGGEFDVTKRTVAATKLLEGDAVINVTVMDNLKDIVLRTKDGFFLRFSIDEIPEKKKGAVGVRGMKLNAGDYVEEIQFTKNGQDTSLTYNNKTVDAARVKLMRRDTKGTKLRI